MKLFIKTIGVLSILGGLGALAKPSVDKWMKERNQTNFRTADVEQGTLKSVVNATGEVQPVLRVQIGSFVSGPIIELNTDFNDQVNKGDLLARIDPALYTAAVARDTASLANRRADVERVEAQLQRARNDERRAIGLRAENEDFISGTEMDRYRFDRMALEAQLLVAKAGVAQAEATLMTSEANLGYTEIRAPVSGVVIDRKIDPGQTLAAGFQTPELFVIAPGMEEKMFVYASIDESDIGRIRSAKEAEEKAGPDARSVELTVDAYPHDVFHGRIEQIRLSSTVDQNIVTYPVVVAVTNPDLKLLPGMTANLTFSVEQKDDVIKVPNSALRFFPDEKNVREEDKPLILGTGETEDQAAEEEEEQPELTTKERVEAGKKSRRRHVWVKDGDLLRAIEVKVGINDYRFTEILDGELKAGMELVTGIIAK